MTDQNTSRGDRPRHQTIERERDGGRRSEVHQQGLSLRVAMHAGFRANPTVVRQYVNDGPIRCERHGQGPDHAQKLFETHDRRERFGYRRQERQRIPLLDESTLPMLLRAFTLGDFDAQAFVRPLQFERALPHTAVEFGMRIAQRVLVLPERSLGGDPLSDIEGVAENVGRRPRLFVQHVAVHPHARRPVPGNDAHQPGVLPTLPDALKIAIEQMTGFRGEKFREVRADPTLRLVAEGACGSRINRQQTTVQIVGTDQAQAVLDEIAISPLALLERVLRLLPGRGDLVELTRSLLRHAPPGAPGPCRSPLRDHLHAHRYKYR